ncbi:MAG: class I SAM-dependent methyltransferase [Lachnospiraceae bacterium]|nr:class I SAM-dependent methyltransferase [Lachnospiraceae bacterium]
MRFSAHHRKKMGELFGVEGFAKTEKCNVCGGTYFERMLPSADNKDLYFIRCRRCNAITYNLVPTAEIQKKIYENYDYWGDAEGGQYTFSGEDRFAKHLYAILPVSRDAGTIRILDFGGGDGSLAKAFAENHLNSGIDADIEIDVVDYGDNICPDSGRMRFRKTFPISSLEDGRMYDIIIASAVMEHLDNPGEAFRILFAHLKKSGSVYFRTPYMYPLYSLMRRFGVNMDMEWPDHIWDMGKEFWEGLPGIPGIGEGLKCVLSRPSIVEKTLKSDFGVAAASHIMKAPWHLFHGWPYVGGWECVYVKE